MSLFFYQMTGCVQKHFLLEGPEPTCSRSRDFSSLWFIQSLSPERREFALSKVCRCVCTTMLFTVEYCATVCVLCVCVSDYFGPRVTLKNNN